MWGMYMPKIFDKETIEALKQIFSKFPRKVTDHLVIAPANVKCETCKDAVELAKALMEVSEGKLEIKIIEKGSDEAEKFKPRYAPAWIFDAPTYNIKYYGLPLSQEFPPFIYVHQYIATGELKIPKQFLEEIKNIDVQLHVKIFVTPECPYCPLIVDALNQVGLANSNVLVETIEAMEFPWEADKYGVFYVPAVIISDVERIDGYVPPDILVKILKRTVYKLKGQEIPEDLRIELVPQAEVPIEHGHEHIKPHEHEHETN